MNAQIEDRINPGASVAVEFSISSRNRESVSRATVSFNAAGDQLLAHGGTVTVNGHPLTPAPLSKQGYWYVGDIPVAANYELKYVLGLGFPVARRNLPGRVFDPAIPMEISQGSGLVIPFAGPIPKTGERIFAQLSGGGDGPGRWGVTLKTAVSQNMITVQTRLLAKARLGEAKLYVGVMTRETSPSGDFSAVHAMGTEKVVRIVD